MSQAVLISIRPKWCELIASGRKTVEVRKTKPNAILPLKCYIYCTQRTDHQRGWLGCYDHDMHKFGLISPLNIEAGKHMNIEVVSGKVIGEFVCHNITRFDVPFPAYWDQVDKAILDAACLTYGEAHNYLGHRTGWAWHISDLVIYDKPKELSEFKRWNRTEDNVPCAHMKVLYEPCETCTACNVTRTPQSWMYVEELK